MKQHNLHFYRFIVPVMLLVLAQGLWAQGNGRISGKVVDEKTQEPLIGVNIEVLGSNTGTTTDSEGSFWLEQLIPGTYRLRFSYIGYQDLVLTDIIVNSARPAIVNARLLIVPVEGEAVTVTSGYFSDASDKPVSNITFSREEIRRFPGGFEDVVRTVASLPGVSVVNEGGRNDLLVRGGGPSENLYLVNNIEVPNINHFGSQGSSSGSLSFVNLDFVENVEFSTGGFGVRYGDKMSSVMALTLRPGREDRLGGKATISATQFGLNLEGPLGQKGNFIFSARKSYLDLIFKAAGLPFIPTYTDFNLVGYYDLSPRDKLTVLGLAAIDRVDRDQSTLENRVTNAGIMDNTQNQFISGINYRRLMNRGFVDLTLNSNYNEFRFSQIDEQEVEYFNSRANEIETGIKLTAYRKLSGSAGLFGGLSYKHISNDNRTVFADTIYNRSGNPVAISGTDLPQRSVVNTAAGKYAAHLELEKQLLKSLSLSLGIRGDYYSFLEDPAYPAARAALRWQAGTRISFKASLGRYFQAPSYVWVVNPANRDLKALRNDMAILGGSYLFREDLRLSLETYYKRYRDLPTGATPETAYLVLTNTGVGYGGREDDFQSFGYIPLTSAASGRAYGAELLLQKRFSDLPLYGQMSLAWGKSEYTAGNEITYPGEFDQRFIFNLSGGYKFNRSWEVSAKFRLFSGAPFTPVYRPAENGGTIQNLPGEYLAERLETGHLLDVRIDRRFNFRAWSLILFADVQNVYNNKLQLRPRYDFWEDVVDDREALGLLPSIGISAEF